MASEVTLPDGLTKHAVRVKLINNGRAQSIIEKLAPGFYDESIPKYYNVMRFLEKVRKDAKVPSFEITVPVSLSTTFYAWVFQFVGKMRIVGPEYVRTEYAGYLQEAIDEALGE